MGTTTGRPDALGITPGTVIMEIGWDEDCDEGLRSRIVSAAGADLLEDDTDEVVDVVLLWWRSDDGDLIDGLVDAIGQLTDKGIVWLLTPKRNRTGHIESAEISEAAPVAGLQQTSTVSAGPDWQGTRLVSPGARRT